MEQPAEEEIDNRNACEQLKRDVLALSEMLTSALSERDKWIQKHDRLRDNLAEYPPVFLNKNVMSEEDKKRLSL